MHKFFLVIFFLILNFNIEAQVIQFPSKPIRLLVGFPPGGPIDLQARLIAQRLNERLKQPVIVENRPGADAVLATQMLAKSAPDGHTLILASIGFATVPSLNSNLPYNPYKDFAPVIYIASGAMMLVAHPSLNISNLQELIQLARTNPGQINYGSAGLGSSNHLGIELLGRTVGVNMNHVPYKGAAPATSDLLAGQIQLMLNPISNALPLVKNGKLRAIAVSTNKRSPSAVDVPTINETIQGFDISLWSGILVPNGTPENIKKMLNTEINLALNNIELKKSFLDNGFEVVGGTQELFGDLLNIELRRWQKLARDLNLKIE